MHIGIFGATGTIGGCVVTEAVSRRHRVTAFTRSTARFAAETGAVSWKVANVVDANDVAGAIEGLDVVVNAINSGSDPVDMIANAGVLPAAARTLLTALARHPTTRLIVVGGGASLEVSPGLQALDVDGFADQLLSTLGLPAEYVTVLSAHREAMNIYRLSDRFWTYLSPSAGVIARGQRTGRFRIGGDQLLWTRMAASVTCRRRTWRSRSSTRPSCRATSNAALRSAIDFPHGLAPGDPSANPRDWARSWPGSGLVFRPHRITV